MSLDDLYIKVEPQEIEVNVDIPEVELMIDSAPDVIVLVAGNIGPIGPPGQWRALTQAEYDALDPPDLEMLYVIIG